MFCHTLIKSSNLSTHTSNCAKRPIKCIRCSQQFPADEIVGHSRECRAQKFPSPKKNPRHTPSFTASSISASGTIAAPEDGRKSIPRPPSIPPPSVSSSSADANASAKLAAVSPATAIRIKEEGKEEEDDDEEVEDDEEFESSDDGVTLADGR